MSDKNMKKFDKEAFTFVNNDRVLTDVKLDTKPVGYLKDAWNRFKKNKASVAATVIILLIALFAIIAPWCTPYKINQADGYYKQVRPKVSAKANGFWDGSYNDDLNDSGYIALQAIALAALDPNGDGSATWDDATNYALNPIRKVNRDFVVTSKVDGVEKTTGFHNLHVDSYYKVGFVNINGLTREQYHDLLSWQERTGIQVTYPMIDNSDSKVFPESNKGDANEANYWYAMTRNLTPLYPNDPNDLSQGYHEMTLQEVKEKGLWSLYASDYLRDEDGNVIWYNAEGKDYAVDARNDVRLFYNENDELLYTLDTNTGVYTDANGKMMTIFPKGSVFFRNDETRTMTGAISKADLYRNSSAQTLTRSVDDEGNEEYQDAEHNVYIRYDSETGAYFDGNGNPLTRLSHGTSDLFVDENNMLVGAITEARTVMATDGRVLTAVSDGSTTTYYDDEGNVVYVVVRSSSITYTDGEGNVLNKLSSMASTVYLLNGNVFVTSLTPFGKMYKDQNNTNISVRRKDGVETYSLPDGTVICTRDVATNSYFNADGDPLTVAGGNYSVDLLGIGDAFVGGIITRSDYRDETGTPLFFSKVGGETQYRDADGNLVYRKTSNGFFIDKNGNVMTSVPGRTNLCLLDQNGAVVEVAYSVGVEYHAMDGSKLVATPVYFDLNGNELTAEQAEALATGSKYIDVRYTDKDGNLVYYYNDRLKAYFDQNGVRQTQAPDGSVFFMDHSYRLVDALQAPPKDQLMRVRITTSGEGGIYKNYSVRVLYYNYYQYINGHEPVFVLGADSQGYDILVRLAYGCRLSLILAVAVSLINLIIGAIYGAIEGYYGGAVDMVMERITDILSGIPFIILVTLFKLHLVDTGKVSVLGGLLFAFVVTGWIGTAYSTRMQFYRFKGQEYILAARTLGANDFRLMFKHIFPNALGTLITSSVLVIPGVIFSETSLAYLGIVNFNGATMTSLGTMLNNGQAAGINKFPHIIFFPALILSLLMISFNLFGNGLRDAFNPSLRGTED